MANYRDANTAPSLGLVHLLVERVQEYAIFVVDTEGRVASWNEGGRNLKGYVPEEIVGKPFASLFTEEEVAKGQPERELAIAAREGRYEANGWRRRKDGSAFLAHVVLTAYRNDAGELEGFLKITRDITREKEARERADSEHRRLEDILDRMPIPLLLLDAEDGSVLFANSIANAAAEFPMGVPARTWLASHAVHDEAGRRLALEDFPVMRALRGEDIHETQYLWEVGGKRRHMLVMTSRIPASPSQPAAVVVAFQDVTRLKESEERLRQAQKMEAIGRLAGGVAHDFNNLLTAIRGYADLMAGRLPEGDPNRADLREIQRASERAASLTNQLLAFSRKQMVRPARLDLNEVTASLERMLHRLIGEDIDFATQLHADPAFIMADRGQVEQVLMNLALNAKDAMPGGGRLRLATENVELGPSDRNTLFPVEPGPYVRLVVADEGTGIPEDVRPHIFEPFFTTKEPGKGTGLGLSTVYAILREHRANLAFSTRPGRGTVFCVYWPVPSEETGAGSGVEALPAAARGADRTILLVEDEPVVRTLTRRILEGAGFRVTAAEGGAEALAILGKMAGPPDLLITDVVMAGMNGRELMEEARRRHPGLKGLFMSGYTDDEILRRGVQSRGTAFIGKPFGAHDLLAKVREILTPQAAGREDV